jgi:hypothetical protein
MSKKSVRVVNASLSAFIMFSTIWIVWAFLTPGDYFGNGNIMVEPTLIGFPVMGLLIGFLFRSRKILIVLSILTILFIMYWLFVPTGWWAHSPRPMTH